MSATSRPTIVILGGGYAGLMACARLAQARHAAHIVLIDAKPEFVQRIRLHEALAGQAPRALHYGNTLPAGVAFRQARAERIDAAQRCLHLADGSVQPYDYLLYALGSTMQATLVGGEYAQPLNTPAEAAHLHPHLADLATRRSRVLVLGAGLAGLEIATELAERWPALQVLMACRGEFGAAFNAEGRAYLRQRLTRLGVRLREHTTITRLTANAAVLGDSGPLPFDLCLWAGGLQVPSLARDSGLPTDAQGRLLVTADLRLRGQDRIFALGDCAHVADSLERPMRMACATAMPMGAHGGDNLVRLLRGQALQPFRFAYPGLCVSLGRQAGLIQLVDAWDRPGAYAITGRWGARIKEWVCRYTWLMLRMELRGYRCYQWRRGAAARHNADTVTAETDAL